MGVNSREKLSRMAEIPRFPVIQSSPLYSTPFPKLHTSVADQKIDAESIMLILLILLVITVSSREEECPLWFTPDISNSSVFPQCVCSDAANSIVTCNQEERTSYIKIGHCAYQDHKVNATVVANVPYVFPLHLIHDGLIPLPYNISELIMWKSLAKHRGYTLWQMYKWNWAISILLWKPVH